MSIRTSPPPPEAINSLQSGMDRLRARPAAGPPGGYAAALSGSQEAGWEDGLPHPIYNLGLDTIRAGGGLDAAQFVGWRFLLGRTAPGPSAAAEVYFVGGQYEFAGFNFGPFVAQTFGAMTRAQSAPDVRSGDFELRLLQVLALYVVALWLKDRGTGDDILIPLAPAPPELQPGRHYTGGEFMAELMAMSARPTGPPPAAP